ncbi:hypothetical protein BJV77DRAFT_1046875 [Russula vinacea]|nr:hypothetical protein BJV77DRAFT_1046875 [Russula vinacea]
MAGRWHWHNGIRMLKGSFFWFVLRCRRSVARGVDFDPEARSEPQDTSAFYLESICKFLSDSLWHPSHPIRSP